MLRHQLIVLRRRLHGRVRLTNNDRWFFVQLYRWFPSILQVLTIIQPETLVRWHRAGFRCYWRWKSRPLGGRPQIDAELRGLIRRMSMENPLWGAPRIHGELLKLGLRSLSRASPNTWSNDGDRPARDGGPSCVTTRRTSPPWTCSLFERSVSTCSMPSSSSGWTAETSSGLTSQKPDSRVGCTSNHGGISLEWGSALYDPGPRSDLRRYCSAEFASWEVETSQLHRPPPGRMVLQNGYSDRSGASALDHVIVLGEVHLRQILKS